MKRKIIKILGIILIIVVVLGLALVAYTYYKIETGQLIQWEGKWYTPEELKEKYPPQHYEVEAKNTPEEVYKKFREAVINNNKEKALQYIAEDQREEYRKKFDKKSFFKKFKEIPKDSKIKKSEKESFGGMSYYYYYLEGEDKENDIPHSIIFIKTKDGYWKIESI